LTQTLPHQHTSTSTNQQINLMAPYAFVDILGGPAVVGEPVLNDLQMIGLIRRGLRRRALDQLAERSELTPPILAAALDLSIRTLQRYGPEQRLGADATDRLVHLATLYAEGFDTFGEAKFRIWMNSPILALGNRKPVEFIDSITGIRLLRDILGRINHGVFS
jgi:putative toxin-antitoxin system antitoxin component (TIGR02293 family)